MARNGRDGNQSPDLELDAYKKEIGKQYMDGLLSEKEYTELLANKKKELGLDSPPAPRKTEGEKECPTCGALVNGHETECAICGSELVPVLIGREESPKPEEAISDTTEAWREEWLVKEFRNMTPEELMKQRPDAIKGVSARDSDMMASAFNVRTLEDFASLKYAVWARELVALKNNPSTYRKKDFRDKLTKKYEDKELDAVLQAPSHALQGVSENDAKKLADAFNVKTIEDLGTQKYLVWASKIYELAHWREEWIVKQYRQLPPEELLKLPPDVLKGVSAGDSNRMKEAFNIKTLEQFATNKFLIWARELAALKEHPDIFRKDNFKYKLIKKYEDRGLDEILKAPTFALQGVSDGDSEKLTKAFNTKTIEELGTLKYLIWASKIYDMAPPRIYKVGERVLLPSGQIGRVSSVTEPDERGMQKVEVAVGQ